MRQDNEKEVHSPPNNQGRRADSRNRIVLCEVSLSLLFVCVCWVKKSVLGIYVGEKNKDIAGGVGVWVCGGGGHINSYINCFNTTLCSRSYGQTIIF